MKNGNRFITALALVFACCMQSCIQYNEGGNYNGYNNYNINPGGGTGSIKGHITLYDAYGRAVTTNLGGIELNLMGNYSRSSATDTTGYYVFGRVLGNSYYDIYVTDTATVKPYAPTIVYGIHIYDTLTENISLSAIPQYSPLTVSATMDSATQADSIYLSFSADTSARAALILINNTTGVSTSPDNYVLSYVLSIPANATRVSIGIPATALHNAGISSGNMAYFAAYGYAVNDHSLYKDRSSGKYIYNAVSTNAATGSVKAP
jgi:hypothetical protein